MKKVISYVVSLVMISFFLGACDKNNPEIIPDVSDKEETPLPPTVEKLDKVTNIQVSVSDDKGKRTIDIPFEYDEKERLVKVGNFNQQTIEYIYKENGFDIKLSQKDNSNAYYLFKCPLLDNKVQNISYVSPGGDANDVSGAYTLGYNDKGYLQNTLFEGLSKPQKNVYIWSSEGNCIRIEREGYNPSKFNSTNIENNLNIDLNSFLGSFPNNQDLQMLAIIKSLGAPCKNIVLESGSSLIDTKLDNKNRLVSLTKKGIRNNATTEYQISYSKNEE